MKLLVAILLVLSLVARGAHADSTRAPNDFNQDGFSELTFVSNDRSLLWTKVDSQTGSQLTTARLGATGDHVITGDWLGSGVPQLGVCRIERDSQTIAWRIRDSRGLIQEFQFGSAGDTVMAGIDLDSSGAADAVVVKRQGRRLEWSIQFDPFLGGTTVVSQTFATVADSLFYIDVDGTGIKLAARTRGNKGSSVRLLDPISGVVKTIRNIPEIPAGFKYRFSLPLVTPNGTQVVAMISSLKKRTNVTLIDLTKKRKDRQLIRSITVRAVGDTVHGNFLANSGQELAIKTPSGVLIVNPFDGKQVTMEAPSGALVGERNINTIGRSTAGTTPPSKNTPAPRPTIPTNPSEPLPPPSGGLAEVCRETSAVATGEMLVKSEASGHIHGGDPRTTGYTVVCAAQCPTGRSYVPFYYSDGAEAGAVGYFGTFSGNGRPRFYGAVGDAPQHFVNDIHRQASLAGRNGKLYLAMGGGRCKEFGSLGRNGGL